jgi:serine/threonine protein kinase
MARVGSIVSLSSGRRAELVRLLGEGGQGSVYEVAVDDGARLALKWYHDHVASPHQHQVIADLIDRGPPNSRFLWPLELATDERGHSFGYVMSIRPPRYVGLSALLNGAVDATLRSVCWIGHQLADSFLMLHAQGLCYRDISFGNVFFDPETGETLICDNDNVGIDGESTATVIGTKRFMAPEIVRREARPSTDTDLYSLSVLLFYLLMVGHPLLGARELEFPMWDEQAESSLFGDRPLFVFDPADDSNRPLPDVHGAVLANWPIYPQALRRKFTSAFTNGLHDSHHGRILDSEWRSEMIKARDLLFPCNRCEAANFFDRDEPARRCWHCGAGLARPVTLAVPNGTVALGRDTEITAHHVGQSTYDFDTVVARVVQNPSRPDAWGLLNTSSQRWNVVLPDERRVEVEPGRSIGLITGSVLDFGRVTGRIEHTP